MIRSYHRWLARQENNTLCGVPGYNPSTDDILDKMEAFFNEPRSHLKDVLDPWDRTPESVGEKG